MKGFFTKKNTEPKKLLKEYRVENTENFKTGNELGLEILKDKKFIDIKSKKLLVKFCWSNEKMELLV